MTVLDYILYFFFYSFVGWFFESCYCSIRPKKWVNRGFLRGPLCPIYGTGALVIMILLVPLRELTDNLYINELIIFIVGMVVCDIVEFMTSYIMEKLFNARWWDYSGKKFNIQGRICLTHTLYWGTASCLFVFILEPIINYYLFNQVSEASRNTITYICLTVFAFDLFVTVINALGIRDALTKFKTLSEDISSFAIFAYSSLGPKFEHSPEETKKELLSKLNELEKRFTDLKEEATKKRTKTKNRLVRVFPTLFEGLQKNLTLIEDLLKDLKEKINNFIK